MSYVPSRLGPNAVKQAIGVDAAKALRGYKAKKQGAAFEDEIEAASEVYRRRSLGIFTRNFPPVVGSPGNMRFNGPGPVDFTGHWCGVPVAFDCKTVTRELLSYRHDPRKIHQAEFLRDFKRSAAKHGRMVFAFVLVRAGDTAYYLDDVEALAAKEPVIAVDRKTRQAVVPTLAYTPLGLIAWDFLSLLKRVSNG